MASIITNSSKFTEQSIIGVEFDRIFFASEIRDIRCRTLLRIYTKKNAFSKKYRLLTRIGYLYLPECISMNNKMPHMGCDDSQGGKAAYALHKGVIYIFVQGSEVINI